MRVPNRRISSENKLAEVKNLSPKSALKLGKRFTATVLKIDGENVSLEINGKIIQAKNRSSDSLLMGSESLFEVLKSSEEVIEIRAIPLSKFSSSENDLAYIKTNLGKLGINFTEDNAKILSQILKMGIPLSKSNFMDVKRDVLSVQKLAHILFQGGENNAHEVENGGLSKIALSPSELQALNNLLSLDAKNLIANKEDLSILKNFISNEIQLNSEKNNLNIEVETFANDKEKGEANQKALLGNELSDNQRLDTELKDIKGNDEAGKNKGDFIKGFLSLFKNISSDKEVLMKQVVFLHKMGIKPSIFNLSATDSILNGKFGFSTSLAEILSKEIANTETTLNKDFDKLLSNFLKSTLNISDFSGKVDGKQIAEGVKNFKLLNNALSSLDMEGVGKEDSEQMALLKQNASLIKELDTTWQAVFMPITQQSEIDEIEMYIKKEDASSKNSKNDDKKVIYLSLKTDNIERVKSRIEYSKNDLKIIFLLENDDLREHAESQLSILESKLSAISDKKIHLSFNSDQSDINLLDFELITSFKPSSKIDIRI